MAWVKCSECGALSDRLKCFMCSGEKSKTAWRRKLKVGKRRLQYKGCDIKAKNNTCIH